CRRAKDDAVYQCQSANVKSTIRSLGDASWRSVRDNIVWEICEDRIGAIRVHQVERICSGVSDVETVGQRQHSVRIGIREIARGEIDMLACPGKVEVADIGHITELASRICFQ